MQYPRLALSVCMIGALIGGTVFAQGDSQQVRAVRSVSLDYHSYYAQDPPAPEPEPGAVFATPTAVDAAACDACGGHGSDCESSCDSCGHGQLGDCCLGEPWTLTGYLHPDHEPRTKVGGWVAAGYYNKTNGLFNTDPNQLNNTQSNIYLEREADGSNGWDLGYRFDILYGTDAQNTQAFGNPPGSWDFQNGFDHGIYGWALPQLYFDVAYGNWKVRAGKFYTPVGYEVVAAPQNFFYSHGISHNNSEPFTHTGAYAEYDAGNDVKYYGGWTAGWDTGFDQFGSGSSFLGGFAAPVVDDVTFTYMLTAGDFGFLGDDAYAHSLIFNVDLADRWEYVLTSDVLRVSSTGHDTVGITQYLFYEFNDCWKAGVRAEWWKGDSVAGYTMGNQFLPPVAGTASYYETTFGVNYKPQANLVVRPEMRYQWAPYSDFDQWVFAIDGIVTF
ncbi:MAG: outer membrane beta-barrel protein [Pirellulales bacterium]